MYLHIALKYFYHKVTVVDEGFKFKVTGIDEGLRVKVRFFLGADTLKYLIHRKLKFHIIQESFSVNFIYEFKMKLA